MATPTPIWRVPTYDIYHITSSCAATSACVHASCVLISMYHIMICQVVMFPPDKAHVGTSISLSAALRNAVHTIYGEARGGTGSVPPSIPRAVRPGTSEASHTYTASHVCRASRYPPATAHQYT